jgi:predicted enzyme related to lactoylglutathione lyase
MAGRIADAEEDCVRVVSVIADLPMADIGSVRNFYAEYLGLSVDEFNMEWVARYASRTLTSDATAQENSVVTIKVDDVQAALKEAERCGYEIVHPLTTES